MKFVYPAIFKPKSDGGYLVTFPALDKCQAEGSTLEEAIERAMQEKRQKKPYSGRFEIIKDMMLIHTEERI